MSWLFASDSKRIRASASSSVLPMNIQGLFSLGLTGLISLLSKGLSRSSPALHLEISNSLALSLLYGPALTSAHDYWKTICLIIWHGCSQHLQWLWKQRKENLSLFPLFPIYLPWSDGTRCHDLSLLNVEL